MPAIVPWCRSTPLTWARAGLLQDRGERLDGERVVERVGAEAGHAGDVLGVVDDVDRQALLGARLGDVETGPVVEVHARGHR